MDVKPVILKGQRVRLEPLKREFLEELYHAGGSEKIWAYMPIKIQKIDDMEKLMDEALKNQAEGTQLPFVIIDQTSGEMVGSTRFLEISPQDRNLEIGWTWHSPDVWRTVVNTESKYLLLKHCFETLRTIRVQFKTHHENVQSQKAIERIGGVKEGVLRNHRLLEDGSIRHSVYYSILDSEWAEVKHRFETQLLR